MSETDIFRNEDMFNKNFYDYNYVKTYEDKNTKMTSDINTINSLYLADHTSMANMIHEKYMSCNEDCHPFINALKYNKKIKQKRCGVIFVDIDKYTNDISFLVVLGRYSKIWSFPKGRMNYDYFNNPCESEESCAIREVSEETGINLSSLKDYPRINIGRNIYFIIHTDRSLIKDFHINDVNEVCLVEWKTLEQMKTLDCNKDIRAVINYPQKNFSYHKKIYKNC